jgi:3-oxoadipate enol-lactonase
MRVQAGEIKINYELSGNENGPVVMMSHSLGSSSIMWEPQLKALEDRYQLLRFDTRGHGKSDVPQSPYTLEQLAGDAIGLLDTLQIDKVHFVGLSMGGMIAQCLALRHMDRLFSLALCDTAAVIPDEAQPIWQERIDTTRKKGMAAGVDETMQRWFTAPYLSQSPPEVEIIRTQFLKTPAEGFIGCSEAIRRLDYLAQLAAIKLPVLIIVGEDDPGTPVSAAEAIHAQIETSELVIIPSAAHLSNIEQADFFNQALVAFLGRQ